MIGVALAPDRWRRIEELFQAAVEIPEAQRNAFLCEVCGSDDALRMELESLLANDQESPLITFIVDDATARMLEEEDGRLAE